MCCELRDLLVYFKLHVDLDVGCGKALVVGEYRDVRKGVSVFIGQGVSVSEGLVCVGWVGDLDVGRCHRNEFLEHVKRECV